MSGANSRLHMRPYPGESASSLMVRTAAFVNPLDPGLIFRNVLGHNAAVASAVHRSGDVAVISEFCGSEKDVVLSTMATKPGDAAHLAVGPFILAEHQVFQGSRRLAPGVLANDRLNGREPYHRLYWAISALPCDPSSGEMLIERCPSCQQILTWSNATDVARCGTCRLRLWAVEPRMPRGDDVEVVEFFRGLFSPSMETREAFRDRLPAQLKTWPEGAVLELVNVLGYFETHLCVPHQAPVCQKDVLSGVRAILAGIDGIAQLVTSSLERARQSEDRLATTISFALASSKIRKSRSAQVRKFLGELLTGAPCRI
jgi:hypothetical protein